MSALTTGKEHAKGIGSVYLGAPTWCDDDPEVRALLTKIGVPQNCHVCASSAVGYLLFRQQRGSVVRMLNIMLDNESNL